MASLFPSLPASSSLFLLHFSLSSSVHFRLTIYCISLFLPLPQLLYILSLYPFVSSFSITPYSYPLPPSLLSLSFSLLNIIPHPPPSPSQTSSFTSSFSLSFPSLLRFPPAMLSLTRCLMKCLREYLPVAPVIGPVRSRLTCRGSPLLG